MPPAGDHEVHADDREVEEDEEEDQVGGDEQAHAHALQEEEQRRLETRAVGLAQREDRAREEDDRGHCDQRQGEPVDAEVVAAVHAGDPLGLLLEGESSGRGRLVAQPRRDHEGEVGGCDRDPCPPCGRVAEPRKREQGQSGSQGQEDDQTEHVHLTVTRSRTPIASTATAWM